MNKKTSIAVLTICLALNVFAKAPLHLLKKSGNYNLTHIDTIKLANGEDFKYTATMVTTCFKPSCLQTTKKAMKNYAPSSYYLVYKKSKSEWILNKNPNAQSLSKIAVKRISLLSGHVEIMGKSYSDRQRVVVIQ